MLAFEQPPCQAQSAYSRPAEPCVGTGVSLYADTGDPRVREWRLVIEALMELINLQDDWDGQGAEAPSYDVIDTANKIAEALLERGDPSPGSAVATPAGSIILAWQENSIYRELEVVTSEQIEYMFIDQDGVSSHRVYPPY